MAQAFYYGTYTIQDDIVLGCKMLPPETNWAFVKEPAFRSKNAYGRGAGNLSEIIRFHLVARHNSFLDRLNFQRSLGYLLLNGDPVNVRELWFLDTLLSPLPFSFGQAFPNPPKIIDEGTDEVGFITVVEYEFVCSLNALSTLGAYSISAPAYTPSSPPAPTIPPTTYAPNYWVPNAYGYVLRRTSDNAWIRLTKNLVTGEIFQANLGGDPGSTNYDSTAVDVEWTDASYGFGFYDATPLFNLTRLDNTPALTHASAATPSSGYSATKGLILAPGKRLILRNAAGARRGLQINALNEIEFVTL